MKLFVIGDAGSGSVRSEGEYILVNELGQTIKRCTLGADNWYTAAFEDLGNGVYYLIGYNHQQTTNQKIVVLR